MKIKLKICMVLPIPRYGENMQVPPQIGICSYLTNLGHEVDWIIWSDNNRRVQQFIFNGVQIFTTPDHNFFPTKFFMFRILNKIPNIVIRIRSILNTFKDSRHNLIFVRDNILDGLVAVYLKKMHKVPFVFALSNPLEQNKEYYKLVLKSSNQIYYLKLEFDKFIAIRLLHEADLILPISKWLRDDLVAKGIPKAKIMPVSEGVNVDIFRNQKGSSIIEKYHLNNSRVIIYIGTLGKARRLELLIQAFSEVRKRREDVKLLVVGEGEDREDLKNVCGKLGINDDVIFTGQVPQEEVPSFIAVANIGISPVPPFSFYKMSSPIKMFEYMAMAKPVIANEEIPEHKEVLEQSGGGVLVQFTSDAFTGAIIELLDNPERATEIGQKGQKWIIKNRTYEVIAREVEDRFLDLFGTKIGIKE